MTLSFRLSNFHLLRASFRLIFRLEKSAVANIPLIFGFLQKDLTGGMLVSVLGNEISSVLTPLQIYIFGVVSIIGIPCIIALGMFIRELDLKKQKFMP